MNYLRYLIILPIFLCASINFYYYELIRKFIKIKYLHIYIYLGIAGILFLVFAYIVKHLARKMIQKLNQS